MKQELINKIIKLKKEKNAIILAHNYQIDEIQDIADFVGDSLELSIKASNADAKVIVFCGVDFMAESAAILSPEKTVLLPVKNADCQMANMIKAEELIEKKKRHPDAKVVCYVNSSSEIKSLSDVCCTSSNALKIVERIDSEKIIFVPDKNLGSYVAKKTKKEIILWEGYCKTHNIMIPSFVEEKRKEFPNAKLIVHPECPSEIIELADFVGSTSKMIEYSKKSEYNEFIVGTEEGMLYKLKKESPNKKFYLLNKGLVCITMKMTNLYNVYQALSKMQHKIYVEEKIRIDSKKALDKMIEMSK